MGVSGQSVSVALRRRRAIQHSYRINEQVRAPMIRLVTEGDGQTGIVSREEAIERAREAGRPVQLDILDSDHQLLDQIEVIWERVKGFLNI